MRRRLHLSHDLSFGQDYVTKAVAILAQRRKGKTYTANKIAEEMCKAGIPWVAIDPTGAWWGLRSEFPVIVLGGDNGDLPLSREMGGIVAELVVDSPGFYVLDLSHFESRAAEREFATAFAERFYRLKAKQKDVIHLFIDEADLFVPQERRDMGDNRMLGAFESIVKRGGIRGIGTTCITQRSASINKHVLEQSDLYIILRTVGPNDQKAIEATIRARGTAEERAELMGSLASLKLGEAWVWEPGGDPPLFERIQVAKRESFNSSATPEAGTTPVKPRKMAEIDMAALEEKLSAAVEKKKQEDPEELRKQIAQLKSELRQKPKEAPPPPEPKEIEVEVEVIPEGLEDKIKDAALAASNAESAAREAVKLASDAHDLARKTERKSTRKSAPKSPPKTPSKTVPTTAPKSAQSSAQPSADGDLSPAALKMLTTLVQRWPVKLTRSQMATLSGYSLKSSTIPAAMTAMRAASVIEEGGGLIWPSQAGFDLVGQPPEAQSQTELIEQFRRALPDAPREFFDALVEAGGVFLSREELVARTRYSPSSSTVPAALTTLRKNGLIQEQAGEFALSDTLLNA
jgi:hypothetical protein